MSLQSSLESGKFVITAEVAPLKGTDTTEIIEVAELLQGRITAANVTDQQSSVMRLGSLVVSYLLKEKGLEPVFQMTCRDRNRIALQSDLLSASVLGIKNVLALTGDVASLGDHPQAKPVFDLDSVLLLQVIRRLNEGYDMAGNELKGKPSFFPGAVVNPGADTEAALELQIIKMEKKVAAGARFIQTQAIYDADSFAKFMKRVEGFKVPVLAGVIPLKSAGMARFMNKNVAGILVPEHLIKKMNEAENKTETGIQIAADLMKELKDICQGIHIMAIGWEKKVPQILDAAGL
ncbi:MAG: methylenetetrahydrofolate reductase [Chloroflexi bacterium]|nr:methylenetetrahydrofolate reductase [Chloroflexota bacterium]MBI3930825.1 methylenetetrahydrofolate reductase [Chloroflexota bacterium]